MAGAKYWANGEQNLASSIAAAFAITSNASTANRFWIGEVYFGNEDTPADLAGTYIFQRVTTAGTAGASVTAGKNDLADRVAQCVTGENYGTDPTLVANEIVLEVPLNHRGTYRWVAPPASEPVGPAVAADGFSLASLHATGRTLWRGGCHWTE